MKKLLGALAILLIFSSCSNYYKAITAGNTNTASGIDELKLKNKYFILRNGTSAFAMSNISFTPDQKVLQCILENLPDEHRLHLKNGERGKMIYLNPTPAMDETVVLNEVHLYISADTAAVIGPYTLGVNKIQKIEVLEKDAQKTKKSHTTGRIVVAGGILLTVGIIVVASISSGLSSFHF